MTESIVYHDIPRPDPALIDLLRRIPVADLHDEMGATGRRQVMDPIRLRPQVAGRRVVGPAVTAYCSPGDNLMMHAALYFAQAGDVLVISNGGLPHGALWGGNATQQAVRKKVAGIVIDGPSRDTAQVREHPDFGVWSTSITVSRPTKQLPGTVNMPVHCAGVQVQPGDIVVADDDGVIVIPPTDAERLARAAKARIERDRRMHEAIAGGSTLFEQLSGFAQLEKVGAALHEGCWRDDATRTR